MVIFVDKEQKGLVSSTAFAPALLIILWWGCSDSQWQAVQWSSAVTKPLTPETKQYPKTTLIITHDHPHKACAALFIAQLSHYFSEVRVSSILLFSEACSELCARSFAPQQLADPSSIPSHIRSIPFSTYPSTSNTRRLSSQYPTLLVVTTLHVYSGNRLEQRFLCIFYYLESGKASIVCLGHDRETAASASLQSSHLRPVFDHFISRT